MSIYNSKIVEKESSDAFINWLNRKYYADFNLEPNVLENGENSHIDYFAWSHNFQTLNIQTTLCMNEQIAAFLELRKRNGQFVSFGSDVVNNLRMSIRKKAEKYVSQKKNLQELILLLTVVGHQFEDQILKEALIKEVLDVDFSGVYFVSMTPQRFGVSVPVIDDQVIELKSCLVERLS